jgi:inhibitor of KinA sporulation pathway (predicted exonuclease)
MTTTINEEKTISLIDGTKITVRPLKISLLRKFMKSFEGIAEVADDNEKSMNLLMECVQIALQQYKPELAEDAAKLEEVLDLPTVYKIVEEASGIKLTDAALLGGLGAN